MSACRAHPAPATRASRQDRRRRLIPHIARLLRRGMNATSPPAAGAWDSNRLLSGSVRRSINAGRVADARHTELREPLCRRQAIQDHDIDRQVDTIADPLDQAIIREAWNEKA